MKTIGIIGGLGPETTSQFYLQLLAPKHDDVKIYDTMEILLDATVKEALG